MKASSPARSSSRPPASPSTRARTRIRAGSGFCRAQAAASSSGAAKGSLRPPCRNSTCPNEVTRSAQGPLPMLAPRTRTRAPHQSAGIGRPFQPPTRATHQPSVPARCSQRKPALQEACRITPSSSTHSRSWRPVSTSCTVAGTGSGSRPGPSVRSAACAQVTPSGVTTSRPVTSTSAAMAGSSRPPTARLHWTPPLASWMEKFPRSGSTWVTTPRSVTRALASAGSSARSATSASRASARGAASWAGSAGSGRRAASSRRMAAERTGMGHVYQTPPVLAKAKRELGLRQRSDGRPRRRGSITA